MVHLYRITNYIYYLFSKDKKLCRELYAIMGFYPHHPSIYRQAFIHKSFNNRHDGFSLNNERLEYLGDAVLDAVAAEIVYRAFQGKREGFLTTARSKMVQRSTLNRIADEIGLQKLIQSGTISKAHNSFISGNAFEALIGAIYLDRGYNHCLQFFNQRIVGKHIDLKKIAYDETNFKSKLIEWGQKYNCPVVFDITHEEREDANTPVFHCSVLLNGIAAGTGSGYSKRESHQSAAQEALKSLKKKNGLQQQVLQSLLPELPKETVA